MYQCTFNYEEYYGLRVFCTKSLCRALVFFPQAVPLQADDAEYSFAEDAAIHLRRTQFAVDEDNRHLLDAEGIFVGSKLHFYLESISFEADAVQRDSLEYATTVAHETRCGVVDGQTGNEAHIFRGEVRHQHAAHGPVHYVDAADIARANAYVCSFVVAGGVESWQVGGVVAEVGVHFEDVFIAVLQSPAEAGDVGRAQSLLAGALEHEKAVGKLLAL